MADVKDDSEVNHPHQSLPFLEVICKGSSKIRRFSIGTEAGFAVNLINKKLINNGNGGDGLLVSHIEAIKEGEEEEEEEPISFGPNSLLVDYGPRWRLQTVVESNDDNGVHVGTTRAREACAKGVDDSHLTGIIAQKPLTLVYVGKILLALLLLFVFGAVFTLALENLPRFILYVNSSI